MKVANKTKPASRLVSIAALAFFISPSIAIAESDWEVSADIYLWGSNITSTTPGGKSSTLPFYKILDNLDMSVMGGVKAQKDRWAISADAIYMNLSTKVNRDRRYPNAPDDITGNVALKSWIVTPTVGYAIHDTEQARIEIIGGARYLWLESSAKVNFDDMTVFDNANSDSYWDAVIGTRAEFSLSEKWFVPTYFDIGKGDTDLTWQAFAGVGYKFGKLSTIVGYRYLDFEFDNSNKVMAEMTVKGPIALITYDF